MDFHWQKCPGPGGRGGHKRLCTQQNRKELLRNPRINEPYLREGVALLCCALRLAGGIAQSKDDGPVIEGRHVSDDLLSKRPSNGSHSLT